MKDKKQGKKVKKVKNKVGRPLTWTDPLVVSKLIDEYFKREQKPTLAGLAVSLDVSRKTLYNYEERDEFLHIIKKARERVEEIYEQHLLYSERPTGVIFALKNMGWADRQDVDHTTKGEKMSIGVVSYEDSKKLPK